MKKKFEESLKTRRRRHLNGSRGTGRGRMKSKAKVKGIFEHLKNVKEIGIN
jgi:hypothetical protein